MDSAILEHIRTQAVVIARYTQSTENGQLLIREALKNYPQLVVESLEWFDVMINGLTRAQVQNWIDQGYTVLMDAIPHRTFGDLWEWLDRLDEESDRVMVLEELATWSDEQLKSILKKAV